MQPILQSDDKKAKLSDADEGRAHCLIVMLGFDYDEFNKMANMACSVGRFAALRRALEILDEPVEPGTKVWIERRAKEGSNYLRKLLGQVQ